MKAIKKLLYYCSVIFTKDENLTILFLSFLAVVLAGMEIITIGGLIPFVNMFAQEQMQIDNKFILKFINWFHLGNVKNLFVLLGIFLIIISIFKIILNLFFIRSQAKLAIGIRTRLSILLLKNYTLKDYHFHINTNSSVLLKNVNVETNNIYFFVRSLMQAITNIILAGGILLLLLYANFKITMFAILFFGITNFLIISFTSKRIKIIGFENENIARLMYKLAHQILAGMKEIKINKVEEFFIGKFSEVASNLIPVGSSYITLSSLPRFLFEIFIYTGGICFLLIITYFFGVDRSAFGLLAGYAAALYKLAPAFTNISTSAIEIRYAVPALEIVASSIKESKPVVAIETYIHKEKMSFTDCIKLLNIGYSYSGKDGKNEVLKDVNLTINKNDKMIIIGESGAGKSTLINIIMCLIKSTSGEVIFDGVNLSELDPYILSKIMGNIPQDAIILDEDIIANIAFGLPDGEIDKNRIKEILKMVKLEKFCDDLHYQVGENGNRLSGGEKQRITMGRILYKNPAIIILDEITSALDSATEEKIIEDVLDVFSNKTVLIVTHSENLIKKFNLIYKIQNKSIVRIK